jgi:hypothetical protein
VRHDGDGQARRPFANVFHLQPDRGLELFARFCRLLQASLSPRGTGPPPLAIRASALFCYKRRTQTAGGGQRVKGFARIMFRRPVASRRGSLAARGVHALIRSDLALEGLAAARPLGRDFTWLTGQLSPAGITRTFPPPPISACELTSSSIGTTERSVSGFQSSVRSGSPGKICHREAVVQFDADLERTELTQKR